jgi:ELWxxDGT repeat protein
MRSRWLALLLSLSAGLFTTTAARAQPAFRVTDINTSVTGGTYQWLFRTEFVELGGVVYLTVADGLHGTELWRSDGTEAGTRLVEDICPGACSSFPHNLTVVGSRLYFAADDGAHGIELWRSDGTEAGTVLVADIAPGLASGVTWGLFELGGKLYFPGIQADTGTELWTSDGTEAGTVLFADLDPGPGSSSPMPWMQAGAAMFFSAQDPIHGRELWKTDGTAAGTGLVKDILPGSAPSFSDNGAFSGFSRYAALGGRLLFEASDGASGSELWASDGTEAGTVRVKDIAPGAAPSNPFALVTLGGQVLFRADDGTAGTELWSTDGTEAGTALLKDIAPGATSGTPWELVAVGSRVFFRAYDGVLGAELWSSDGTTAGTVLVKDVQAGSGSGLQPWGFAGFIAFGTDVLFFADDGVHGLEPWRSDGTAAGTSLIADVNPGAGSSHYLLTPAAGDLLAVAGGLWYFRSFDPLLDLEVWVSDGTAGGTRKLKEINAQTSAFDILPLGPSAGLFGAHPLADLNGTLLFQASDGSSGDELWRSNGTAAGTFRVKDVYPGFFGSVPHEITPLGSSALFKADDGAHGRELWISDGSEAGTSLLKDVEPTSTTSGGDPWWLTRVGNLVFFNGYDGSTEKLWKSDGTPAGTVPVRDTPPTAYGPVELTPLGSTLVYAGTGAGGSELWKTDGTEAGTVLVKEIAAGAASSSPDRLTPLGGVGGVGGGGGGGLILFSADDGVAGRELWKTDGTPTGTVLVKDILPGSGSGVPYFEHDTAIRLEGFAVAGGKLFFVADDGTTGVELWKSDGTEAGTQLVRDIFPGSRSSEIRWLTAGAGNRVFFVADDGISGRELWTSDGTAGGTHQVRDIAPGVASSLPEYLFPVAGKVVFAAWEPAGGRELWVSDGTEAGTHRLQDIAPGAESSSPAEFTRSGPNVYFTADDAATGFELWALPVIALDNGADFYTVAPCRIYDSRLATALSSGVSRTIAIAGSCGVPATARAVAVTLTVVGPTSPGNLALYPGATDGPATSSINFGTGVTRGSNGLFPLGTGVGLGALEAKATLSGGGQVHLLLDVSGYFQ